jgi:hypothetical protein
MVSLITATLNSSSVLPNTRAKIIPTVKRQHIVTQVFVLYAKLEARLSAQMVQLAKTELMLTQELVK